MDATGTNLVVARPNPFSQEIVTREIQWGWNLAEIIEYVQPDPVLRAHAFVYLDDRFVPRHMWRHIIPHPGVQISIRMVPQDTGSGGGGKDPLRTVLLIAVVVAAIAVPYLPALAATGLAAGTIGGSLLSAGIALAGGFLVNAIAPPGTQESRTVTAEQDSPNYAIQAARNTVRIYQPIPDVCGTHRMAPPMGALPFTEIVGDDQFLRQVFVWSYGPKQVTDIKIGETAIDNLNDIQIETTAGLVPNEPLTLFPDTVTEVATSLVLEVPEGGNSGAWTGTNTTETDTDEFSVDITLPGGLIEFKDDGDRDSVGVTYGVRWRAVGAGTWEPTVKRTIRDKTTSIVRTGIRVVPSSRGQFEFQVRVESSTRNSDPKDTQIKNSTVTAYRSIKNEDPISFDKPLVKTAIRVRASNQFNGVIQTLTGLVQGQMKNYNGSTWDDNVITSNCASVYRYVLQSNANARAVADSSLSLPSLEDWHNVCEAEGYTFERVMDFRTSVFNLLHDIAAAGRAGVSRIDGKWGVVIDRPQTVPVQHFTPRNSWGYTGYKAFDKTIHAFRCEFDNRDKDYVRDERIVYDDGFDDTNATEIRRLDLPGVTTADLVWKHARFFIAANRLRPEIFEFYVDIENLVCTRGALVKHTHDVPLFGVAAGRIHSVTVNGPNVEGIVSDEAFVFDASQPGYDLRIRTDDGSSELYPINLPPQILPQGSNTITFTTPIPSASTKMKAGDLILFGVRGLESVDLVVHSIFPGPDLTARVVCVEAAPAVHNSDIGTIPPFDSKITVPILPSSVISEIPRVVRVVSDATVMIQGQDGSLAPRVVINLQPLPIDRLGIINWIQLQWQAAEAEDSSWRTEPQTSVSTYAISITDVQDRDRIRFRVRFTGSAGEAGSWSGIREHTVVGKTAPPADVLGFTPLISEGTVTLTWNAVPDLDIDCYEIRTQRTTGGNAVWENATFLTCVDALSYLVPPEPAGEVSYLIKARDVSNPPNLSENAAVITIVVTSTVITNISPQVIDNTVLLRWTIVPGTFRTAYYEIRRGADFAQSDLIGTVNATFITYLEDQQGSFTYWITAFDSSNNPGTPVPRTVRVDSPPDFILSGQRYADFIPYDETGYSSKAVAKQSNPVTLVKERASLLLDGVDDYIEMDNDAINGQTDWSLECWFRLLPDKLAEDYPSISTHCIFGAGGGSGNSNEINIRWRMDTKAFAITVRSGTQLNATMPDWAYDGKWHHLAVTRSSTIGPWDCTAYLDGTHFLVSGVSGSGAIDSTWFYTGARPNKDTGAAFNFFEGYLSEIRVHSNARTQGELNNSKDKRKAGEDQGNDVWRAYHQVKERRGLTLSDLSQNGRLATVVGAQWDTPEMTAVTGINTNETWLDHFTKNAPYNFQPADVNTSTDFITLSSSGNLVYRNDEPVRFTTTSTLPAPLSATTTYYVVNGTTSGIKVSTTKGGAAVNLTGQGTGTHTAARYWNTMDELISAGYTHYAMPADNETLSGGGAVLSDIYDFGTTLGTARVLADTSEVPVGSGVITTAHQFEERDANTEGWTIVGNDDVFIRDFRQIKLNFSWTVDNPFTIGLLSNIETTARLKQITDGGTDTWTSSGGNPYTVNFNVSFYDVSTITVTPQGTTPIIAVVDFNDVPNPTSFNVHLFTDTGAAPSSDVVFRWNAVGV